MKNQQELECSLSENELFLMLRDVHSDDEETWQAVKQALRAKQRMADRMPENALYGGEFQIINQYETYE